MSVTYTSKRYLNNFLEGCYQNPVVLIEISSVCNFQCSYCVSKAKTREKRFMREDLFKHIVHQLPQITPYPVRLHVDGEPTLHPKFYEYGKLLNRLNIPFGLATNGSRLSEDLLDLEMQTLISISTQREEFRQRTTHIDYDAYLTRVLDYLRGWLVSDSRQTIYIQIPHFSHKANDAYLDQKNEFVRTLERQLDIEKYTRKDKRGYAKPNGHYLVFQKYMMDESQVYRLKSPFDRRAKKGFCSAPWEQLAILADGRVSFCCADLTGGTAFTAKEEIWSRPLLDLWRDNRIVSIRQSFKHGKVNLKVCQRCLADRPDHALYYTAHDHAGEAKFTPKNEELFPLDSFGCPKNGKNLLEHAPLQPYKYGTNIEFGRSGNYFEYEENGWSQPEVGFTWTDGQIASLIIPIENTDSDVGLTAMLLPFLVPGKLEKQRVNIRINNESIGQWMVTKPKMPSRRQAWNRITRTGLFQKQTATIPRKLLMGSKVTITFQLPDAASPSDLGAGEDKRVLGIAVRRITLKKLVTTSAKV